MFSFHIHRACCFDKKINEIKNTFCDFEVTPDEVNTLQIGLLINLRTNLSICALCF